MENEKLFTGFVLMFLGGLNVIRPEILINFRVWMAKTIYGAEFKPSKKNFKSPTNYWNFVYNSWTFCYY